MQTPITVADIDHDICEAREAELNALKAGNSRAATRYHDLQDTLLELRPMAVMDERISRGVASSLA